MAFGGFDLEASAVFGHGLPLLRYFELNVLDVYVANEVAALQEIETSRCGGFVFESHFFPIGGEGHVAAWPSAPVAKLGVQFACFGAFDGHGHQICFSFLCQDVCA